MSRRCGRSAGRATAGSCRRRRDGCARGHIARAPIRRRRSRRRRPAQLAATDRRRAARCDRSAATQAARGDRARVVAAGHRFAIAGGMAAVRPRGSARSGCSTGNSRRWGRSSRCTKARYERAVVKARPCADSGIKPFESTASTRTALSPAAARVIRGMKNAGKVSVTIAHAWRDSAAIRPAPAPRRAVRRRGSRPRATARHAAAVRGHAVEHEAVQPIAGPGVVDVERLRGSAAARRARRRDRRRAAARNSSGCAARRPSSRGRSRRAGSADAR